MDSVKHTTKPAEQNEAEQDKDIWELDYWLK